MLNGLDMRPRGWFQIAWSTDLAVGQVVPMTWFGQDLVAYRSRAGQVRVLDAHCRHLGAHLGYGGKVTENGIQCPFHGWEWDAEGANTCIPYSSAPSRARLRTWSVHEWNGVVALWHDPAGGAPTFQPHASLADVAPHVADLEFHTNGPQAQSRFRDSRVHPQMIIENAVDPAHFAYVHGTPTLPQVLRQDVTDTSWKAKVGFGGRWADGVDRPDDAMNTLTLSFHGVGMGYNALTDPERTMLVLIAATPVDDTHTEVFGTYWPQVRPQDALTGAHVTRIEQSKAALPEDLDIWENQVYRRRPVLAKEESAGFHALRKWTKSFYGDEPADEQAKGEVPEQVLART